jgi:hypothetical protein
MVHGDVSLVSNVEDMKHGVKACIALHPVLVCLRSKRKQPFFLPSLPYSNVPLLYMRSEARRGNLLVLYPVCGVKRWLASHDFRQ